jgi:hypothetical protein
MVPTSPPPKNPLYIPYINPESNILHLHFPPKPQAGFPMSFGIHIAPNMFFIPNWLALLLAVILILAANRNHLKEERIRFEYKKSMYF